MPALRIVTPEPLECPQSAPPLAERLGTDKLVELSGEPERGHLGFSTAIALLHHAQLQGEPVAWIQPESGSLYPPDLAQIGIDLRGLLVLQIPQPKRRDDLALRQCQAAEMLLRSGSLGAIAIDLTAAPVLPRAHAWQGRLLGLARRHETLVLLLTQKPAQADSLGPLIGVRLESRPKKAVEPGQIEASHCVLKNKSGAPFQTAPDRYQPPWV